MPSLPERYDVVLAGGGLANGLIAYRLAAERPELRLLVVEAEPTLGGNHTWSFHDGDVDARQRALLQPFVVRHWPRHGVRFGARERWLDGGYACITSERFHAVLMHRLGHRPGTRVLLGARLRAVGPTHVELDDGRVVEAGAVIDGRGPRPTPHLVLRHQKFLGIEVELAAPHGLDAPLLMDARVEQCDGFRFVYVLPLARQRLLVEDTYYTDAPALHADTLRRRALAYAAAQGWQVQRIVREEQGVLPIALDGDIDAHQREAARQPRSGLRAGLFHPTTGYSLPHAVRLAELIARQPDLSAPALAEAIDRHVRAVWRAQAYFRGLNRMLFLAGPPSARLRVFERFYGLREGLIGRFYAERLTWADKLRIVSGRPPLPIVPALRALREPAT